MRQRATFAAICIIIALYYLAACAFAVSDTKRFISDTTFAETYFILFVSNFMVFGCPSTIIYTFFAWKMHRNRLQAKEREGQLQSIFEEAEAFECKGLPAPSELDLIDVVLSDQEKRSSRGS